MTSTNEEFVHIREAYWSAGDKYDWNEYAYRTGVGIATPHLRGDGYLTMKLDKPEGIYRVEKKKARDWVTQFKSIETRRGIRLAIIALDCFDKLKEEV